jgi:hypothetical protein
VIGGVGGSGTRLVVGLLREMGVSLGADVNESEDAKSFVPIYDAYVSAYLETGTVALEPLATDLLQAIEKHIDPAAQPVWGWKNPRSIYLLPLLDQLIPGLRFVHVIRHGLDMPMSANQRQLREHGRAVLGRGCDEMPRELRSALLWKRVNEAAADYGRGMGERYFLLRYEDVCSDPSASLGALAAALGLALPQRWKTPIAPVPHRWKELEPALLDALRAGIGGTLERFGYPC